MNIENNPATGGYRGRHPSLLEIIYLVKLYVCVRN